MADPGILSRRRGSTLGAEEGQSRLDCSATWLLLHRTRNSAFLQPVTACCEFATAMGMGSEGITRWWLKN